MGVGSVIAGEKLRAMMLVPFGDSTTGTIRCTPNEFFSEPLICLNFGTFISANDKINTKNAINKVAMSILLLIKPQLQALRVPWDRQTRSTGPSTFVGCHRFG